MLTIISSITAFAIGYYLKNARDAQRKSNLKQVQTALELYRKDCGQYPFDGTDFKAGTPIPFPCPDRLYSGNINEIRKICAGKNSPLLPNYPDSACVDVSAASAINSANFLSILVKGNYLSKELLDSTNSCPSGCSAPNASRDYMYIYYASNYGQNYCLMTMLENKNDQDLTRDDSCDANIQSALQLVLLSAVNFTDKNLYAISSN